VRLDEPKMLANSEHLDARAAQVNEPRVEPLTAFVRRLRSAYPTAAIPNFDPWDGGIEAEALFLLEAPGRRARDSSFVSRNNPDETAKNLFEITRQVGIARHRTVLWNVIPWYIGDGKRIRAATKKDVEGAMPSLMELLELLPRVRAIVLVGRKAQLAAPSIRALRPDLQLFDSPHPSPMFCNRKKENRALIVERFREVSVFIGVAHGAVEQYAVANASAAASLWRSRD
jgi:uracil-DNA glycosylase